MTYLSRFLTLALFAPAAVFAATPSSFKFHCEVKNEKPIEVELDVESLRMKVDHTVPRHWETETSGWNMGRSLEPETRKVFRGVATEKTEGNRESYLLDYSFGN